MNENTYEEGHVRHISNVYMCFVWAVGMLVRQSGWIVARIISFWLIQPSNNTSDVYLIYRDLHCSIFREGSSPQKALEAFIPLCFNKNDSRGQSGSGIPGWYLTTMVSGKTLLEKAFDWMKASRWKWVSRLVGLQEWRRWTVALQGVKYRAWFASHVEQRHKNTTKLTSM